MLRKSGALAISRIARLYSTKRDKLKSSYFFQPGTVTLSHATIGQLVDKAADESGDTIAFDSHHEGKQKTFYEFKKLVDRLASGLVALGVGKGDRVALCAPNILEWPVVQFATAKAGFILVNVNPAYQADELEYCLKQAECRVFITVAEFKTQKYYDMLCSFLPELPSSSQYLKTDRLPFLQSVVLLSEERKSGTFTFEELMSAGDGNSNRLYGQLEQSVQFDDPVNIQFTSGTTGNPKGATLTHHSTINNMLIFGRRLGYHRPTEKPVLCCQVPLYHAFGCIMGTLSSLLYQFPCVFPSARYNAEETLKAIEDKKCTIVYGTPTMFVDMLNEHGSGKHNVNCLKQALLAGAVCPEVVLRELNDKMNIQSIHIGYGCTENSPIVAIHDVEEERRNVFARLIPGVEYVEFKVVDPENHVVPVNTGGELCVRGHVVFHGYWNESEKTAEVIDQARWFHTGDLAKMDENGYMEIIGRLKDMVIRGGENIYPQEIENFLHKHPAVLEAHICGVPDDRMGEELCAWLQLKAGEQLSEQDVKGYCKGKISHFKIPRYILFVEDFPKTVTGKIQKFKLREISIKMLGLQT